MSTQTLEDGVAVADENNATQDEMEGTKPVHEHQWLQKLVGEWRMEGEMVLMDGTTRTSTGKESVKSLNGLWAVGEGSINLRDGRVMQYHSSLGYDVSFKEYRGCRINNMSSHLWKYTGTLSEDGKVITLDCVGPDMVTDGGTANYREVLEFIDADHYTFTSSAETEPGTWISYWKGLFTRI